MKKSTVYLLLFAFFALICVFLPRTVSAAKEDWKGKGDTLFEKKNYKDAAIAFAKGVQQEKASEDKWHCAQQEIVCYLRLGDFDSAEKRLEPLPGLFEDSLYKARAHVIVGDLYLSLPHWGYTSGGVFYRGQYKQGTYSQIHGKDKAKSVSHFEAARDLYAELAEKHTDAEFKDEQISALFSLVSALSRFSPYDSGWSNTWFIWGDEDDGTVGESEGRNIREGRYRGYNSLPKGLPVDSSGNPVFIGEPKEYSQKLHPGAKIKYILSEIAKLDTTKEQKYAGQSLYRRAMLARARYGADRLNSWGWYSYGDSNLRDAVEKKKIWELKDNEVLTLAGGKLAVITLPADEDIISLLRQVSSDYPKSGYAEEAQYALGMYYKTRKQYTRAVSEFDECIKQFPGGKRAGHSSVQIAKIKASEVNIDTTAMQMPGVPSGFKIGFRNTDKVTFKAYNLDVLTYIRSCLTKQKRADRNNYYNNPVNSMPYELISRKEYRKYLKGLELEWSADLADDGTHRINNAEIKCDIMKRGAYLVEAYINDQLKAYNILMIQDTAIVQKNLRNKKLYYVCSSITGEPLKDMDLDIYAYSYRWDYKNRKSTLQTKFDEYNKKTDTNGICEFAPVKYKNYGNPNITIIAHNEQGYIGFFGIQYWSANYNEYRRPTVLKSIVVTDRPVYRPEQSVKFKIWARSQMHGEYKSPADIKSIFVEIKDPKYQTVFSKNLSADNNGGADGEFSLKEDAPLGMYSIRVKVNGRWAQASGNQFRVEEYKKPEFEVTVTSGDQVKLGETFEAVIRAKYYFGAPVSDAEVTYKVFREEFTHSYIFPGYWDWLYGSGYGIYWYDYDWFPWWGRWGCRCYVWYPWWGSRSIPQRDLITVGEGTVDENGELKISIDTAEVKRQFGDTDHIYTVKAEVKDKSRRTIEGEGKIKVTRNEFRIFMQPERGYFRTGQDINIDVQALTPGGAGKKTEGTVRVSRVSYRGENNALLTESPVKEFRDATGPDGKLDLSLVFEKSGQYKIEYETVDGWNEKVLGAVAVWVVGSDFNGSVYRFSNLELLTDKRTYKVGETAHVMLNAARAGIYVIFSDEIENGTLLSYRLIHLDKKSTIIDVPIKKGGVPNFFIEATAVFDGDVHTEAREICVPPEQGLMNVNVSLDKSEYTPGSKGTVNVELTDLSGEPVKGEVCLAAFDKSVLYIQPELTPDIRQYFYGQKRYHYVNSNSNLERTFRGWTSLQDPSSIYMYGDYVPEGWMGSWGERYKDWRTVEGQTLGGAAGNKQKAFGRAEAKSDLMAMDELSEADAAPAPEAADREAGADRKSARRSLGKDAGKPGGTGQQYAEVTVRKNFADTALWKAVLKTDAEGKASTEIEFPENLTTWKVNCYGLTGETRVGSDSTSAVTTKNLILRLQAPRFFVEKDEVVLSANIHNYLETVKTVKASINVSKGILELLSEKDQEISIPAGGEARVDWLVKVTKEGTADIQMEALTDEESDAVKMSFPVMVHGIAKTVSNCGSILSSSTDGSGQLKLTVPKERKASESRLEVRFSPSLAGAMIDALPYLVSYPYGCTEQTTSRFVPTVLVRKTLQDMGIELEEVKNTLTNLNAQQIGDDSKRRERFKNNWGWADSPVFDSAEVDRMISEGLKRLTAMQHGDGGWGWWANDDSNPYMSSYVLYGLLTARDADVAVDQNMITSGLNYLNNAVVTDREYFKKHTWKANNQAFILYVLAMGGTVHKEGVDLIYSERDYLSVYGKAMLSLACSRNGDKEKATVLLENILQYVEQDDENQTAWLKTSNTGWWYWYNSDIESNALLLRALTELQPESPILPKLVKWLLNNRRNGYYWRSTRDTALCVSSMVAYMRATGENKPDYTLQVIWDGKTMKEVEISKDNFLTFDNSFVLAGDALTGGDHTLQIVRKGEGAVYYSAYLDYFTQEEGIKGAGLEIKVARKYYKLDRVVKTVGVENTAGGDASEKRLRYNRTLLEDGAQLKSGDLLEIELLITSKNDYDYLAFEDFKPAGCEPVALRSGYTYGELCSNMELRDEKIVFFIGWLNQGSHLLKYRMRAEIPGTFHALPTKGFAMYAPELKCNSDEIVLKIED